MSNPKSKPKTKSNSATRNGKHQSRAEEKAKLRTGEFLSAQRFDHSLARIVEPAEAEARRAALRGLTGIEKARQLFRQAGLAFPTIPKQLAARNRRSVRRRSMPSRGRHAEQRFPIQIVLDVIDEVFQAIGSTLKAAKGKKLKAERINELLAKPTWSVFSFVLI